VCRINLLQVFWEAGLDLPCPSPQAPGVAPPLAPAPHQLVPSKGALLLVRRAVDESIESAVPYVELSAVPHVELQFVRSTGTLLSASDAPRAAPWYIPIPADAEGLHGARYTSVARVYER
jgi:hypothetical protein